MEYARRADVVVVTGGSDGIGYAIASKFVEVGYRAVLLARDAVKLRLAVDHLGGADAGVLGIPTDVSQQQEIHDAFATVDERCGRLDVLVNNAGTSYIGPTEECPVEEWDRVLSVNLRGAFLCAQQAGKRFLNQGAGCIINVGSVASIGGLAGRTAYTASKHGLLGLTRSLGAEWTRAGIRTIQVNPGYVSTEVLQAVAREGLLDPERISARTPLGRMAQPKEIAHLVVSLAGEAGSYVSGTAITADGGLTGDLGVPSSQLSCPGFLGDS